VKRVAKGHALYNKGLAGLGGKDGFESRDILGQKEFMHTTKHPQLGGQGGTKTFTGITMDLPKTIAIIITCPFMGRMANCMVVGMQPSVMGCLIGVQYAIRFRQG
jgi:hypothetical protein